MKKIFILSLMLIGIMSFTGCNENDVNKETGVNVTISSLVSNRLDTGTTINFETTFNIDVFMGENVNEVLINGLWISYGDGESYFEPFQMKFVKTEVGSSEVLQGTFPTTLLRGLDLDPTQRWITIEMDASAYSGVNVSTKSTTANIGWELNI